VKELCNSEMLRGHHKLVWDGKDKHQRNVGSGVYFVKCNLVEMYPLENYANEIVSYAVIEPGLLNRAQSFVCPECFLRRWTERSPDTSPAGSQHETKGVAGNGKGLK